jgi:hypothetical protein
MNGIRRYYVIKLHNIPLPVDEYSTNNRLSKGCIKGKEKEYKTHWDCMKCDGHGVIIRNNELVNCDVCGSEFL